jgi:uncharacterized protein YegP (UPF0339 family)
MRKRAYRFELYESSHPEKDVDFYERPNYIKVKDFRIRLVSNRNGKILWITSEPYASKANARHAYVSLIHAIDDHSFEDLTRHAKTSNSSRPRKHKRVLGKRGAKSEPRRARKTRRKKPERFYTGVD